MTDLMSNEKFAEIRSIIFGQAKGKSAVPVQFRSNLDWKRNCRQIGLLTKIVQRNARVLDLGCGWGHTAAMLAVSRPDLGIIGLDRREASTWKDFEKYGCHFHVGDALNLKIKDKVDLVVSFGVMEHVKDDRKFLKEIYGVLKPGGFNIVFNLPNRYSLPEFFARALGKHHHKRTYARRQVESLFNSTGFEVLKVGREHMLPAQVGRIHWTFEDQWNRHYLLLDRLDMLLSATKLGFISQVFTILSKKMVVGK